MALWFLPQYNSYMIVPFWSMETALQLEEKLSNSSNFGSPIKQKEQIFEGLKLGLAKEDLEKVGYHHKRNNWTEEQDKKLMKLVISQKMDWTEIGQKMGSRNSKMCYSRFRRLSYQTKKRWTLNEENKILSQIENHGQNWKKIAEFFTGILSFYQDRTQRQIQQHYEFCLKPNLNKTEWTLEEDLALVELLQKYGTQWKLIEVQMKQRTQNQIKNRYFGRLLKIVEQKRKIYNSQM